MAVTSSQSLPPHEAKVPMSSVWTAIFSRKWNMREHCRTQHNFDPVPNPRSSPIRQRKTIGSSVNSRGQSTESASVQKFLKMMRDSVRFQQTGIKGVA